MRTQLFLNHATPEDNQFTQWLAAKLSYAGYDVWCDFHRLRGGQDFWDEIEDVIRNRTFRFLALTSKVSQNKAGVQKEVGLATVIESKIPDFIIPIRVDDVPFDQLKISVVRKNIIDFHGNWQKGLNALLLTLRDANTPTQGAPTPLSWLIPDELQKVRLEVRPEVLESNWYPIQAIPTVLNTIKLVGGVEKVEQTHENMQLPWFQHVDQICSFASSSELYETFSKQVKVKRGSQLLISSIYDGDSTTFGKMAADALDRMFLNLTRQCWEIRMETMGLIPFESAFGEQIWFLPNDLVTGNKVTYADASGKRRRKNLVGHSTKRNVYWHYGVSCHPQFTPIPRFEFRSHVIFTQDGETPLYSADPMHKLRRGFCRNWWNDQFRTLLKAYVSFVSNESSQIILNAGTSASIKLSALPFTVDAPVALSDLAATTDDVDLQIDESDDLELVEDNDDDGLIEESAS